LGNAIECAASPDCNYGRVDGLGRIFWVPVWFGTALISRLKTLRRISSLPVLNPILRAAITHLYFKSIHPFEDGNGRIGRALAENALHQGLGQPILISLSSVIESKKQDYYEGLKTAQQSLQIDSWLLYFAEVVMKAQ
jgi:Fic family protein